MNFPFGNLVKELGSGEVVRMPSGEKIFKMDTYKGNPIIKPQDIGLSWYKDGKLQTGAVFNGGAELFKGKVILLPRCQKDYQRKKSFDEKLKIERSWLDNYISEIWPLISEDGINFTRYRNIVIRGDGTD